MPGDGESKALVLRLERAISESPKVPELHCGLGLALSDAGRDREAGEAFDRARGRRREFAPALDGHGILLQKAERYAEALPFHERAVASDPSSARAHHNRGNALLRLRRYPEAQAAFEEAIRLDGTIAEAHNGLGAVFEELGKIDDAVACYRAALALRPAYAAAACNLGNALRQAGDLDEALEWSERAVALEPSDPRFHRHLVDARPEPGDGVHLLAMERLSGGIESLSLDRQIDLHFALGKAYSDLGRYDDAFARFHEGNVLRRSQIAYDEAVHLGFLDGVRHSFAPSFMQALRGSGNASHRPIFIVGLPRSGSTLVEQVLAALPGVRPLGEVDAFERIVAALPRIPSNGSLADLQNHFRTLGDRYVAATGDPHRDWERATDKLLSNFRFVPLIHLALPNARIIDVRRDALDTCWSCYTTRFTHPQPFVGDLGELGRYCRAYTTFMDAWEAAVGPQRLLKVRYEEIVDDFEHQTRRIAEFCGLPWDRACLEFYAVRRPVLTSSHSQVRRPLYRSSVGRAKPFMAHLGALREALTAL
jgi:tetratricopeptide (TPR) repeat protein